ncbi:DUF1294 domain-containing protein [Oceanisphaera sp. W20_SRM_FM3]|uniref:DUF1294 domain-containing protein n=1 Tax=Oceanisphaera sp. W20_SRM_FM3 TaxID=3240267 RepID=UPI003F9AB509
MKATQYFSLFYVLLVAVFTLLAWLSFGYFNAHFFGFMASYLSGILLLSAVTYVMYAKDKRAARLERRRTPEHTLHWLALLGGWPGALFAQARLHHKTQKQPFKTLLWLTILLHIIAVAILLKLT